MVDVYSTSIKTKEGTANESTASKKGNTVAKNKGLPGDSSRVDYKRLFNMQPGQLHLYRRFHGEGVSVDL